MLHKDEFSRLFLYVRGRRKARNPRRFIAP